MSLAKQNEQLVRGYFGARNRGDSDHAQAFLHPDFVRHSPPRLEGIPAYNEWLAGLRAMWGDEHWTILETSPGSERVWVWLRNESTHIGLWHGLPATGERVTFETVNVLAIRDGRIADLWRIADDWSRVRQLGGAISWPGQ